jgi:hypothetical protein
MGRKHKNVSKLSYFSEFYKVNKIIIQVKENVENT